MIVGHPEDRLLKGPGFFARPGTAQAALCSESTVQPQVLRKHTPSTSTFLFYFPLQTDSLPTPSPSQFWCLGTYLLLLTELLPSMLQHVLITHGVALEVAAFSCYHITAQGKEAGLQVVFPESDLKRKGRHHSSSSSLAATPRQDSRHTSPWLTDPFPFLLHRKTSPLGLPASLSGLLFPFAGPGTRV